MRFAMILTSSLDQLLLMCQEAVVSWLFLWQTYLPNVDSIHHRPRGLSDGTVNKFSRKKILLHTFVGHGPPTM
jgi:hypothetical protein